MEVNITKPQKVNIKSVRVLPKYVIQHTVKTLANEYVPGFFPTEHFGDYLDLTIDIETGKILNWVKPSIKELVDILSSDTETSI